MTTASWSTRVRQSDDATFQEWRDEFITKLGLMVTGGVLAADETNITPGAGARPAANTEQGYAVYHISDSLHSTAPIYIRFGFGSHTVNTDPRIQVTVGTSTNGSGVIGGTALSTIASILSDAAQTTDTARQSYMSCTAGFFGVDWKVGSGSNGTFFICRTVDSDGAITATGAVAHWGIGNSTTITKRQSYRYAATASVSTAQTGIIGAQLGYQPFFAGTTAFGGNVYVFVAWAAVPYMAPVIGVCGVNTAELAAGGTFTATPVGSTPRTYLSMNTQAGPFSGISGFLTPAMLWE